MSGTLLIAHRGDARQAPENTLPALLAAIALPQCDGLEFDVRASRDSIPILLHDETLERVQGRPDRASDLTAAELARLGIPNLADVLAAIPPTAFLDVELKEDVAAEVVRAISTARGSQASGVVISSFDVGILEAVRRGAPTWATWLNAGDLEPLTIRLASDLGCVGISAQWRAIDERSMARATEAGLEVAAWTVTDPPLVRRLAELGVRVICAEGEALDP